MAFPDDVYQYFTDTTRQPLVDLLSIYNDSRDNAFDSYRNAVFNVAVYHGDTDSSDPTFFNYIATTAVSLGYVVLSNGYYVWKV